MLIQVELRDTSPQAKRLRGGRIVMPSCRVLRQPGDGLRLSNLAIPMQKFYHAMTAALLQKDPDNPEVDALDKGTFLIVQGNLQRFLTPPQKQEDRND